MPLYVIVAEDEHKIPVVLTEWIHGIEWIPITEARARRVTPRTFRDRWRAKRQSLRLPRGLVTRVIPLDRL